MNSLAMRYGQIQIPCLVSCSSPHPAFGVVPEATLVAAKVS